MSSCVNTHRLDFFQVLCEIEKYSFGQGGKRPTERFNQVKITLTGSAIKKNLIFLLLFWLVTELKFSTHATLHELQLIQ